MRKNYFAFLSLILIFCAQLANAQSCPPTGFSDGTSLYFFYDMGTSLCADRPTVIYAGGSTFSLVECGDSYSVYDITSGSPLSNPNTFTADFGYGTCEYTNGVLTNETLSSEEFNTKSSEVIRLFPNPITSGNYLFVDFGSAVTSADIKVFSVTGKQVQAYSLKYANKAPINVSSLSNGVYLLQISSSSQTITRKFVVMK